MKFHDCRSWNDVAAGRDERQIANDVSAAPGAHGATGISAGLRPDQARWTAADVGSDRAAFAARLAGTADGRVAAAARRGQR